MVSSEQMKPNKGAFVRWAVGFLEANAWAWYGWNAVLADDPVAWGEFSGFYGS